MSVSLSQLQKSASTGSETQYLSDYASFNKITTALTGDQKAAALAARSVYAQSITTGGKDRDRPDKSVYASKATSFNDTYNISQSNHI